MRRAAAGLAAAAGPSAAAAHDFAAFGDPWSQILAGALVPLSDPALLLALVPLGVALGLWREDGLPRLWPALAAGLAAGAAAAPLAGLSTAFAASLAGLATGLMGAAARAWPVWLMAAASVVTGLVAGMTALEGHSLATLPGTIHLGVLMGALVTVAAPFGLVSATRERVPPPWPMIGWRVVASWLAAIALMLAALSFA
jgi:hypothetical protein